MMGPWRIHEDVDKEASKLRKFETLSTHQTNDWLVSSVAKNEIIPS